MHSRSYFTHSHTSPLNMFAKPSTAHSRREVTEETQASIELAELLQPYSLVRFQTSRQLQVDFEEDSAVARLGRLQEVNLQKSHANLQSKLEKAESRIHQLESDLQTADNMDKQTLWQQYVDTKSRLHKSQDELEDAKYTARHKANLQTKLERAEFRIQQLESDLKTAENMDKQTLWLQYVDTKHRLHRSQDDLEDARYEARKAKAHALAEYNKRCSVERQLKACEVHISTMCRLVLFFMWRVSSQNGQQRAAASAAW